MSILTAFRYIYKYCNTTNSYCNTYCWGFMLQYTSFSLHFWKILAQY